MAEVVNIASLSIDVDQAVKNSAALKKRIDELRAAQKALTKENQTSSEEFVRNDAELKKLNKSYRSNQTAIQNMAESQQELNELISIENKSVKQLQDSRSQLINISKNITGSTEEEREERERLNRAIDEQTKAIREQSAGYVEGKDRVGEYRDSIIEALRETEKQREILKQTQKELEANIETVEEGTKEYEEYSEALIIVNKDLAKLDGNLEESNEEFDKSILTISGFATEVTKTGNASAVVSKGIKGATTAVKGLTKAALTFIATPVGAIITAIVVAITALRAAFTSSEEGQNRWNKIITVSETLLGNLNDIAANLGETLIDLFKDPQKALRDFAELIKTNIVNRFKGMLELLPELTKAVGLLFRGEFKEAGKVAADATAKASLGIDNITERTQKAIEKTREFAQEQIREARIAENIADQRAQADRLERELLVETSQVEQEIARLREQSRKEQEYSAAERKAFLLEAGRLQDDLAKKEEEVYKLRADAIIEQNKLSKSTKEDLTAQAQAIAELNEVETRRLNFRKQLQSEINTLTKQEEKAAKERLALEIETQQEEIKLREESVRAQEDSYERLLEFQKTIYAEQEELLKQQLENDLITQQDFEDQLIELKKETALKESEIAVESAKEQLDIYLQLNKSRLREGEYFSEQLYDQEVARLDNIAKQQKLYQQTRLEEGVISERQYNELITQIDEDNYVNKEATRKEREEAKKQADLIDWQNEIALMEEQGYEEYLIKSAQLARERQAEIENAEKTGADVYLIDKLYAERQAAIDETLNEDRAAAYDDAFGQIKELFGEQTAAGKAAGIAQATINTYQGVSEVWKAPSVLPEPANTISKVLASGITLSSGFKTVREISGVSTKFSKGDILKGNSHKNGGIPFSIKNTIGNFEAEGGEAIINKKSTAMFTPLLSAINVAGGGKKFASGGIVGQSSSMDILNVDSIAEKIAEANSKLPPPVVSVQEINTVNNNVQVIETLGTI